MILPPNPYPVHSFPPKLQALTYELLQNYEVPPAVIASSLIGALSGSIQGLVDVERKPGFIRPCVVFTWVFARSGERKSAIDRLLMKHFAVYVKAALKAMRPQIAAHKVKQLRWKLEYQRLEKLLETESNNDDEIGEIQDALEAHLLNNPGELKIPKIYYKDTTPEGIRDGLRGWPYALLNSNEAGALLGTRTMSNLGFFNELWDGEDLHIERVSSESFIVEGPRLTISFMVQWKTFCKYMKTQGSLARDNGFFARFLFCYPDSTMGTRFGTYANGSTEHLDKFHARMLEILMGGTPNSDGTQPPRVVLTLSPDAQVRLENFANNVEADCGPGRFLSDVTDSASKAADNAVRLAGLFHYYEGLEGPISSDTIGRATSICSWHLEEFKRIFGEVPEMPLELQDSMALEKCLWTFVCSFCAKLGSKKIPLHTRPQFGA